MRCLKIAVLFFLFLQIQCKRYSKRDEHVQNRETHAEGFFPDWVPFKNKHGDELGEFVSVKRKSRIKKRLAQPISYLKSSFADADDYFEKDPGNEGSDYFGGEWGDSFRSSATFQPSEIDGVLGILSKSKNQKEEIKPATLKPEPTTDKQTKKRQRVDYSDDEDEVGTPRKSKLEEMVQKLKSKNAVDSGIPLKDLQQKLLLDHLKQEEAMQTEERQRDIEILEHSNMDKYNRKVKPKYYDEYDEIIKDLGIEKYKYQPIRKTTPTSASILKTPTTYVDAIPTGRISVFRNPSAYMVFDEDVLVEATSTSGTVTVAPKKTYKKPTKPHNLQRKPDKTQNKTHKTQYKTQKEIKNATEAYKPISKTSVIKTSSIDNMRISFVPQDSELREGEPTLFFPKKTKMHHISKEKTDNANLANTTVQYEQYKDTSAPNLSVVKDNNDNNSRKEKQEVHKNATSPAINEVSFNNYSGLRRYEAKQSNYDSESEESRSKKTSSTESGSSKYGSGESTENIRSTQNVESSNFRSPSKTRKIDTDSLPSGTGTFTTLTEPMSQSSKRQHDVTAEALSPEAERGGMREHHAERQSEHTEKGRKEYSDDHKEVKTEDGHHDKEDHLGSYHDHGGHDEEHHDEKEHHGTHVHAEHGKKHAEYEESGRHSKGHSTKGSHDVHKKEEYEKNIEFFEYDDGFADQKAHRRQSTSDRENKGNQFQQERLNSREYSKARGEQGFRKTGHHNNAHRAGVEVNNLNTYFKEPNSKHVKKPSDDTRKWIFFHTHPAKTANFMVIDRRNDQLHHGPQYYG